MGQAVAGTLSGASPARPRRGPRTGRRRRGSRGATAPRPRSGRRVLHRLDVPSAAYAAAVKPGWLAHRLVVVAADTCSVADEAGHGARHVGHVDVAEAVAAGRVLLVADDVGQVLVERAAGVHGHHLHAPADPQHRQARRRPRRAAPAPTRRGRRGQPTVRGCGSAAYRSGSTSAPPVTTSPSSRATTRRPRRARCGGSSTGTRRPPRRRGVRRRQDVGGLVPDPPAGLLPVGREPDHGGCRLSRRHSGVT